MSHSECPHKNGNLRRGPNGGKCPSFGLLCSCLRLSRPPLLSLPPALRICQASSVAQYSAFASEDEWLYPPNSSFRVLKIAGYNPSMFHFAGADLDFGWALSLEEAKELPALTVFLEEIDAGEGGGG